MKYLYPAIFTPDQTNGYTVTFPNLPGCITEGETLEEAYEMAVSAMGGWIALTIEDKHQLEKPSSINDLELEEGEFCTLIFLDLLEYLRKNNTKAVKRTISLPAWLDTYAQENKLSLSKVLQEALNEIIEQ